VVPVCASLSLSFFLFSFFFFCSFCFWAVHASFCCCVCSFQSHSSTWEDENAFAFQTTNLVFASLSELFVVDNVVMLLDRL
jgi:hypothetical protein